MLTVLGISMPQIGQNYHKYIITVIHMTCVLFQLFWSQFIQCVRNFREIEVVRIVTVAVKLAELNWTELNWTELGKQYI